MVTLRKKIVIRVDAGPGIGAGHFMRMIAFGDLASDLGFEMHFLTKTTEPHLIKILLERDFFLHDFSEIKSNSSNDFNLLVDLSHSLDARYIVLDGDVANSEQERQLKLEKFALIRVCDSPDMHYHADLVICPNYGFDESEFSVETYAQVNTGTKQVILRKEIAGLVDSGINDSNFDKPKILISLGASGLNSSSLLVHITQTAKILESKFYFAIIENANDPEYSSKLLTSQLGILSTGSSMWEAASVGLPFFTISLNEQQKSYANFLIKNEVIRDSIFHSDVTVEKLVGLIEEYFDNKRDYIRINLKKSLLALEIGSLSYKTVKDYVEMGNKNDSL